MASGVKTALFVNRPAIVAALDVLGEDVRSVEIGTSSTTQHFGPYSTTRQGVATIDPGKISNIACTEPHESAAIFVPKEQPMDLPQKSRKSASELIVSFKNVLLPHAKALFLVGFIARSPTWDLASVAAASVLCLSAISCVL